MSYFKGGLVIKTYGCQMNEYDSQRIAHLLKINYGVELVYEAQEASIVILNTCSVREKAEAKAYGELGRWRKWKENKLAQNDNPVIAIGGCVAQQEGKRIRSKIPYVDIVFGPQTIHKLPSLINNLLAERRAYNSKKPKLQIDISFPTIKKFDNLPKHKANSVSSYVSIMEGCSKYCSFCIVPYTRGEEFSRPFNDVIEEVKSLALQGVREINFLGQNVNAYKGFIEDREASESFADLAFLIEATAEIQGIDRIRYTTSHPNEMTNNLIQVYSKISKLVSHLHLPIQSGSDVVLNRMKRNYLALEYKALIKKIYTIRPDLSLSGDFIVGFPGETDLDHQKTMKIIEDLKFDRSFSFIYSPRPGTPAVELADDIPMEVKKQRLYELQDLLNYQTQKISAAMVGSTQKVLVENLAKKNINEVYGRTENNRIVNFKGGLDLIGSFVEVKITDSYANSMRGEMVNSSSQVFSQFQSLKSNFNIYK